MNNETIIQNVDITNIRISDGAYRCYILLQSMCYGEKDFCFPSEKYIATALGRSVRTIQRYLLELIKAGLILKKRRGSISNLYTILAKKTKKVGQKVVDTLKRVYNGSRSKKEAKESKTSTFNNFKQRNYDFKVLEDMLFGRREYNAQELYMNQT